MFIFENTESQTENYISNSSNNERRKKLNFHLKTGDYFGVLSTALSFWEDDLSSQASEEKTEEEKNAVLKMVRNLRSDLNYLNRHYSIVPKVDSVTEGVVK